MVINIEIGDLRLIICRHYVVFTSLQFIFYKDLAAKQPGDFN